MQAAVKQKGPKGWPRPTAFWDCPSCGKSVQGNERYRYPESGLLAKHCGCKTRINKILTPEQLEARRRERSIEYKRNARREAGAILRSDISARAAARRLEKAANQPHQAHVIQYRAQFHDAHVNRYRRAMFDREKYAERYKINTNHERKRCAINNIKRKQQLKNSYVIELLVKNGVNKNAINEKLINLKRELLFYKRLSWLVQSTVKQHIKEENESITKHA